jgi:hypothetical protein
LQRAFVDTDDRDDGAGLFERAARFGQFGLLEPVADERGDPLSFDLHKGPAFSAPVRAACRGDAC